jgi:hypothetical protein
MAFLPVGADALFGDILGRPDLREARSADLPGAAPALEQLQPIAFLDRLVHNAHRLTLKGESMRKTAAKNAGLDVKQDP